MTYPTDIDSFAETTSDEHIGDVSGVGLSALLNTIHNTLEAIETKVGITGSAVTGSVDYQLGLKELLSNKDTSVSLGTSDTKYASQNAIKSYVDTAISNAKLAMFPVGSIYISVSSTNPGTFIGGTWSAFGAGKTLVGFNASETEFDTVEETGGEKTHTLTLAESPAHSHDIYVGATKLYYINDNASAGSGTGGMGTAGSVFNTNAQGSGSAHNNLQPYIVTYMFKRTA